MTARQPDDDTEMTREGESLMSEDNFRYASAPERRERLLQFIGEQGYCTIAELSAAFSVSEMTIRRDVNRLVERGKVRGFRGGVGSLSRQEMLGSDYHLREMKMEEAKRAIALEAVGMIDEDAVVAIDAGTTSSQLATLLPHDRRLTVVTPSFPVVSTLVGHAGVEVICLGGTLHAESLSFEGSATLAAIANLQVQTLFLGASGVNERGAFCANEFDAITKRALIEVAERVVLLIDSSKFYSPAKVKSCGWDVVDRVLVDDAISDEQMRMLEEQDVDVVTVKAAAAAHALTPVTP